MKPLNHSTHGLRRSFLATTTSYPQPNFSSLLLTERQSVILVMPSILQLSLQVLITGVLRTIPRHFPH